MKEAWFLSDLPAIARNQLHFASHASIFHAVCGRDYGSESAHLLFYQELHLNVPCRLISIGFELQDQERSSHPVKQNIYIYVYMHIYIYIYSAQAK